MKYLKLLLIVFVASMLDACNRDTGLNPGGGMGGSYVITANINGQSWGADDGYGRYIAPFGFEVRGTSGTSSNIFINISPYNGLQTYYVNGITKITYTEGGVEYNSTTGQITVTQEDDYYIDGIFNAELISNSGGPTLNFTNGQFHVPKY
jgi:hypothetical protein